jgi:opacity protein-like surface antigen
MLKTLLKIASFAYLISLSSIGHAQALPTAVAKGSFQVGGGFSYAHPDYTPKNIQGISVFGDFDFTRHIGVEADLHYITLITPGDLGETSYLAGPRFIYPKGRFKIYGKALFGTGTIVIQEVQDNPEGGAGTYFAYAIGGGLDIQVTNHIVVRAPDVEYQHWSFQTGLTPTVLTIGAAFRFR